MSANIILWIWCLKVKSLVIKTYTLSQEKKIASEQQSSSMRTVEGCSTSHVVLQWLEVSPRSVIQFSSRLQQMLCAWQKGQKYFSLFNYCWGPSFLLAWHGISTLSEHFNLHNPCFIPQRGQPVWEKLGCLGKTIYLSLINTFSFLTQNLFQKEYYLYFFTGR